MTKQTNNLNQNIIEIQSSIDVIPLSNSSYSQIWGIFRRINNETPKKEYQWESQAFALRPYSMIYKFPSRFSLFFETAEGNYSNDTQFTDEMFEYYYKRAQETTNPVLKTRYLDVIWEYKSPTDGKLKLKLADDLIKSCLELAKLCESSSNSEMLMIDSYYRAVSVALSLNITAQLKNIINLVNTVIDSLYTNAQYRWILDLAEIILMVYEKQKSLFDENYLDNLNNRLDFIQENYKQNNDFHLQRETLKILDTLTRLRKQKNNTPIIKIAESFIDEAKRRIADKNYLSAAHFYEMALREYMKTPDKEMVKKLKTEVRKCYKSAVQGEEFKQIGGQITIPQKDLDNIYNYFVSQPTLRDALYLLGASFIPDIETAKENVKKELQKSIFMQFAKITPLSNDLKVVEINTEDEKFNWRLNNYLITSVSINSYLVIGRILDTLRQQKKLSLRTLMKYFDDWGFMEPKNISIIEIGLERYFKQDYVSALYILVPQFESTLRNLLFNAGIDVTSFKVKTGTFEEKPFGFLFQEDVKKALGNNLIKYIAVVMVEKTGLNLRNEVAHGLLGRGKCLKSFTDIVIHLFLTLTRFSIIDDNEGEKNESSGT